MLMTVSPETTPSVCQPLLPLTVLTSCYIWSLLCVIAYMGLGHPNLQPGFLRSGLWEQQSHLHTMIGSETNIYVFSLSESIKRNLEQSGAILGGQSAFSIGLLKGTVQAWSRYTPRWKGCVQREHGLSWYEGHMQGLQRQEECEGVSAADVLTPLQIHP